MKTCKDCEYKAKNTAAVNAHLCAHEPPIAVPMQSGGAHLAVAAIRPPVTDDTPACHHHTSTRLKAVREP